MVEASEIKYIPNHVAFIVDGNRRWAKSKGLPSLEGHRRGIGNLEKIFDVCKELGIKYATAWVFSTENWTRSKDEVTYLFNLFREHVEKYREKFVKEQTRFVHLGRKDRMSADIVEKITSLEEETKNFTERTVCIAMDYGGHDEIIRAVNKLIDDGKEVTDENISNYLDTANIPNPDLIIRTSGELRLSGFMSWQSAYSEYYFPKVPFPDFTREEFLIALQDFSKRDRRFGGDSKNKK